MRLVVPFLLGVSYVFEIEPAETTHMGMLSTLGRRNFGWSLTRFMLLLFFRLCHFRCHGSGTLTRLTDFLEKVGCMEFHCSYIYKDDNIAVDSIAYWVPSIRTMS